MDGRTSGRLEKEIFIKRDWMGMEEVRGYFQGGNFGFGNVFLKKGDEEGAHHGVQQHRSRLVASTGTDAKV